MEHGGRAVSIDDPRHPPRAGTVLDALAKGFTYSIYLMLLIPFVVFDSRVGLVWKTARKRQALTVDVRGGVKSDRQVPA
jgi:hypothetical protein